MSMEVNENRVKYINVNDMYYNINSIMSLNKTYNFIISPRCLGKTSSTWRMLYRQFKEKNKKAIVIRRQIVDILDSYIDSIANEINKFLPDADQIKFLYSKGSIKQGVVDVYCVPASSNQSLFNATNEQLFFRVIGLSVTIARIKSQVMPGNSLSWIVFDEFMPNTRDFGEKHLNNEIDRFLEVFNTYTRCATNLRCIFLGNVYSKYSPYFSWLGVRMNELSLGNKQVGSAWVVEYADLSDELREHLMKTNPTFQVDYDKYKEYSLYGTPVNDANVILIDSQPQSSRLLYLFRLEGKLLAVYRCLVYDDETDLRYWIRVEKNYEGKKGVYCFDLQSLLGGTHMTGNKEKGRFELLFKAYRYRQIGYADIEASALMDEIYDTIGG